jgi:hypothetical protein
VPGICISMIFQEDILKSFNIDAGELGSYLLLNHNFFYTSTCNNEVAIRLRDMIPDSHFNG